jgi:hypothetical protein
MFLLLVESTICVWSNFLTRDLKAFSPQSARNASKYLKLVRSQLSKGTYACQLFADDELVHGFCTLIGDDAFKV